MDFKSLMETRRSYYSISKNSPITDEAIMGIVMNAVRDTPTAFNCQSQMAAVVFGNNHDKVWDIAIDELRKIVPPDKFADTEQKLNSFKSGYGTILYFNDDNITKKLQEDYSLYADRFPIWSEQSSGMLQFAIWSLLEGEGLGASLQHYNPLIDNAVKEAFNIPVNWRLIAQMPFGTPTQQPDYKEYAPICSRVKIIK